MLRLVTLLLTVIVVASALTLIPRDIRAMRNGDAVRGDVTEVLVLDEALAPATASARAGADLG